VYTKFRVSGPVSGISVALLCPSAPGQCCVDALTPGDSQYIWRWDEAIFSSRFFLLCIFLLFLLVYVFKVNFVLFQKKKTVFLFGSCYIYELPSAEQTSSIAMAVVLPVQERACLWAPCPWGLNVVFMEVLHISCDACS
jgi:hypothetical protein